MSHHTEAMMQMEDAFLRSAALTVSEGIKSSNSCVAFARYDYLNIILAWILHPRF